MYPSNKRTKSVAAALLAILAFGIIPANGAGTQKKMWVKAQGRLGTDGVWVVETLKKRRPGKRYVLEGRISKVHRDGGTFILAGHKVFLQPQGKVRYVSGEPAPKHEIRENVRVKALGRFVGHEFHAAELRIFQFSDDDDVEVEGPLAYAKTLKTGHRLLRVGAVSLLWRSNSPAAGAEPSWLSQRLDFKGKFKFVDNSRPIDEPDVEFSGGSKRYGKLQTTFGMTLSSKIQTYSRLEFYWRDRIQPDPLSASQNFEFRLRDLYLSFQGLVGLNGLQLRVGRQRFRDRRTWLMDSRLDAVQLLYKGSRLSLALAVSRGLGRRTTHSDQLHYIGKLYYRFGRGLKTTFYLIKQKDERPDRDDPLWLAVQTRGRLGRVAEYWAQGARYSSQLSGIRRIGYAYDAGVVLRPLARKNGPFASYHFAYGSADDKQTMTVRERFRQPRLQLNYYLYGTRKRLYYYGGLLSPELSNLSFQAFSLGYRVSSRLSVQGIWRIYRQVSPSRTIRSNSLGITPEGISTHLGDDAEILLNVIPLKPLAIAISAEWFRPGDAFAAGIGGFFGLRSELTFYF